MVDAADASVVDVVLDEVKAFLDDLSVKKQTAGAVCEASSWEEAVALLPDANMALFSIPESTPRQSLSARWIWACTCSRSRTTCLLRTRRALRGRRARRGFCSWGSDCGTGIVLEHTRGLHERGEPGHIGIVGASGTGIQEVTCIIDRLVGGCVHAIGTGGRDLSEDVGAITVKDAIVGLSTTIPPTSSSSSRRPPAPEVRDEVVDLLQKVSKPVVAIFLGEKPEAHQGKVHLAHTLEEAARMAVDLARGEAVKKNYCLPLDFSCDEPLAEDKTVVGLYSGGTLAAEAGMMISEALDLGGLIKKEGFILQHDGYDVIDLGDDIYTQGKPHPMIDPEVRIRMMREYAAKPTTGVILLDCVLGYGCHPDMASALAPVIVECREKAVAEGRDLHFVATVVGTQGDPQDYDRSVRILKEAGAVVEGQQRDGRARRARAQGRALRGGRPRGGSLRGEGRLAASRTECPDHGTSHHEAARHQRGRRELQRSIRAFGGASVQFNWRPLAGGDKRMIHLLSELAKRDGLDAMNQKVIERFRDSQPFLVDVVLAKSVIPEINGKVLFARWPSHQVRGHDEPHAGLLHRRSAVRGVGRQRGGCACAARFRRGWPSCRAIMCMRWGPWAASRLPTCRCSWWRTKPTARWPTAP